MMDPTTRHAVNTQCRRLDALALLVERDEPVPDRALLEEVVAAEHRPRTVVAPAEDPDQPARELVGNRPEIDRAAG